MRTEGERQKALFLSSLKRLSIKDNGGSEIIMTDRMFCTGHVLLSSACLGALLESLRCEPCSRVQLISYVILAGLRKHEVIFWQWNEHTTPVGHWHGFGSRNCFS